VRHVAQALVRAIRSHYLRAFAPSLACLLACALFVTNVYADSSVLLVVKGAPDLDAAPYELRLRSEFAAEGLEVVTASGRSQRNILDLEGLARRTGAVAALSVYVDAQEVQGRLWVSDPNSSADLVRTLRVVHEGDSVSVFALRAVEALRGARLELEHQRRASATGTNSGETGGPVPTAGVGPTPSPSVAQTPSPVPAPSRPPPKPEPPTPSPRVQVKAPPLAKPARTTAAPGPTRWKVLLGAAGGLDENGLGWIGAPYLDLGYRVSERLALATSLSGPFIRRLSNEAGVVQVDQELLELQARLRLMNTRRLALEGLLSTGPSRISVAGSETTTPSTAASAHAIGWLFGAGIGAEFALTGHWVLGLDFEWLRRVPSPVIFAGSASLTGETDSLILGKLGIGVAF